MCIFRFQADNFPFSFKDIDDCVSNPCENGGICSDLVADYQCACVAGFAGKNCSESKCFKCFKNQYY